MANMDSANSFNDEYNFFDKYSLKYNDPYQIMGMGGPYIGTCEINGKLLNGIFTGPPRYFAEEDMLVLPKYYRVPVKNFRVPYNIRFRIYILLFGEKIILESIDTFEYLFIEGKDNNDLVIYEAFHNKMPEKLRKIKLVDKNFTETTMNDDMV